MGRTADYDVDVKSLQPRNRPECKEAGYRPCPFVSCPYHLYLDVNEDTGTITFNFPDIEPTEMRETCALDLADRHDGEGMTLEEVGAHFGLTRERIRQIEGGAIKKLKEAVDRGELEDTDFEALGRIASAGHILSGVNPAED